MRAVGDKDQFTPVGIWIRENLRDSREGLSVTNLDYVFEDFKNKRLMLVEEKQRGGALGHAQRLTFAVLDKALRLVCREIGYEYWGFYVLSLGRSSTMPGLNMALNGKPVTQEQLADHLNFKRRVVEPMRDLDQREASGF